VLASTGVNAPETVFAEADNGKNAAVGLLRGSPAGSGRLADRFCIHLGPIRSKPRALGMALEERGTQNMLIRSAASTATGEFAINRDGRHAADPMLLQGLSSLGLGRSRSRPLSGYARSFSWTPGF
jgi:hypothetical protein